MLSFFDLFSGIGGFRLALERAGFRCIGYCEIDSAARLLYEAWFKPDKEEFRAEDARTIDPAFLPDFDILCAGFPCQSFSLLGNRRGLKDPRGALFWEIARIADAKRPPLLLLENVRGLLSHDRGRTFEVILKTLDELGYDVEWQVLNSKDFGVPQNRERVFIIGHLRGRSAVGVFPLGEFYEIRDGCPKTAEEVCENPAEERRGATEQEIALALTARMYASWNGNYIAVFDPYNRRFRKDGNVGALRTNYSNGNSWLALVKNGCIKLRKLTPKECFRLQGFPDEMVDLAKELGISDSKLYRMIGNAVTVPVVEAIAHRICSHSL